ncbi:MAG TPA: ACT domain-containing protein, partial [Bryobacteraceae bacterium]|nr:ACT domain-containing protein [Bryobacteraceae bacterium]
MTEQELRDNFFETRGAAGMLAGRTALVDHLVRTRWAGMPPNVAIAAVGGYGRSELFPHSDIDLLILTPDERTQTEIKEPLSLCIRDLWDKNLRVSQSVHVPAECNQIDSSNAELAVSLLDRRFLAGDEALFRQIRDPKPELGRNIAELTRERHSRFLDTIYHLEPNVKDTPGGLRDLQVLRWFAKLGSGTGELPPGVDVLFEIRCFLHYLSGRDDNKLSFERQDQIARLCGSPSPEDLMRRYYRAVRGIARLANRRLTQFEAKGSSLFAQFRDRSSRFSNADFSVVRGEVFFRSTSAASDPEAILRLFDFVARHGLPLSTDIQERLEANLPRFQAWVAVHPAIWPPFREIIRQQFAAKALRVMHEVGALEAIFPALRDMEALVIRDFNHRYTVDEHTLVAIQIALDLKTKQKDYFGELARETEDLDLLIVALLFHDVGKGTPGESHVTVSDRIARAALRRAGISERAWGIVSFLILGHLEMSAAMSGRDVSDPATARDLASRTGTVECLRLLTLLTFADISAVHPTAMTSWRRTLLWNLFVATNAELTSELTARTSTAIIEGPPERRRFLEGLPPRYFRTHSEAEVASHMRLEAEAIEKGAAVALVHSEAWVLTVVAHDRPFLFASIAAALSSFGFNILKAEAFSNLSGTVIDTFTFSDPHRNLEQNPGEVHDVTRTVLKTLKGEISVDDLLRRRPKVKPDAHAVAATRIQFDNESSPTATLVELTAQDRPGLLFDIASLISKRGANIEVVLVDTEAKKAIDVFYVTKAGRKLSEDAAGEL